MPEADRTDVIGAVLVAPDGREFDVASGSVTRKMGPQPDTVTVEVYSISRFKEALEFDGAFAPLPSGKYTRTILPEPKGGRKLSAVGWTLKITPRLEAAFEIKPLILMEAAVIRFSVADSSQGPVVPDVGDARDEAWSLTLVDTRIFWGFTGALAGPRNVRDPELTPQSVLAIVEERDLEITPPLVKFDEEKGTIELEAGKEITRKLPEITGFFQRRSIPAPGLLWDGFDLMSEIAERCPMLTSFAGEGGTTFLIGPAEIRDAMFKFNPIDVDYGKRTFPSTAFDMVSRKMGIIVGLSLEGGLIADFDAVPIFSQFEASGIVGRQFSWSREDRGARYQPRASSVRFYPEKVIKEIVIDDFNNVARLKDGSVLPIGEAAGRAGLSGKEGEIAYNMATKTEVERPGEKDVSEQKIDEKTSKTKDEVEAVRVVNDSVHRLYRYVPNVASIQAIAQAARSRARMAFNDRAKAETPEVREGTDALPELASSTLYPLDTEAVLDGLLLPPFKITTSVGSIALPPKFISDFPFHRYYDIFGHIATIVQVSFPNSPSPILISPEGRVLIYQSGFDQDEYDKAINAIRFYGAPTTGAAQASESFEVSPPKWPRLEDRTYRRRPADFSEAKHKTRSIQARFKEFLGKVDGSHYNPKTRERFWREMVRAPGVILVGETPPPTRDVVPLGVFVTWISFDVSQHVKEKINKDGVVGFDVPLGIFSGSGPMRTMMIDGEKFLRELAESIEFRLLNPRPPPPSGPAIVIPPVPDTLALGMGARAANIVIDDDESSSKIAKDAIDRPAAQTSPEAFAGKLLDMENRSPGLPLWQIADLKPVDEKAPKTNKTTKPDVEKPKKKAPEPERPPVATPSATAAGVLNRTLSLFGLQISVPEQEGIATTETKIPASGGERATVVSDEPVDSAPGTTEAKDAETATEPEKASEEAKAPVAFLAPPRLLARFYVEAPFDEAAWPAVEYGDTAPATIEHLKVAWIETAAPFNPQNPGASVLTLAAFQAAARDRWMEINADSTVEEGEEIEIGGVFKTALGAVVRSFTMSWGEGGADPKVLASTSTLLTRRAPGLRAIEAMGHQIQRLQNQQAPP